MSLLPKTPDEWQFKFIHGRDYTLHETERNDGWKVTMLTGPLLNSTFEIYDVRLLEKVNERGHNLEFGYDIMHLTEGREQYELNELLLELIPDIIVTALQVEQKKAELQQAELNKPFMQDLLNG